MIPFRSPFRSLVALVLILTISNVQITFAQFPDTIGHQYQNSIDFLQERHVVEGHADGKFLPDGPLNRAEMLKILLEIKFKGSIANGGGCFQDVNQEWFAKYVCLAKDEGIVNGYPNGTFLPGQEVNMVEALKMAIETFDLDVKPGIEGEWYKPYVEFAHQSSLFSKHSYLPDRPMTRGEMAFLVRQLILNQEGTKPLSTQATFLSDGCGKNPPFNTPTSSVINGVARSYITVIPDDYNSTIPKKLIFAFHGRTNSNDQVQGYYGIEEAAGNEAIVIYPSGLPTETSPRNWMDPSDKASKLRDYALFDQLLEEFSSNYCIDLDEVYVVGHSLGAWFTNSLACFRGDKIRAVGSLGGGTSIGECTGPVATMIWHNPNDQHAPFSSGEQARDQYISQNQCSQTAVLVEPHWGNCVKYQGCYGDAPLLWCPHTINSDGRGFYYPHTWPDGTGKAIWEFFESVS